MSRYAGVIVDTPSMQTDEQAAARMRSAQLAAELALTRDGCVYEHYLQPACRALNLGTVF